MTDSTTQAGQKKAGKRRNRAFGCVVAGGILFITAIAVYAFGAVIYSSRTEKRIAELEQRIRDKGQPITLEELEATYLEIPDGENAALIYVEAMVRLESIDPNSDRSTDLVMRARDLRPEDGLPEDLQNDIANLMTEFDSVFALFEVASNLPSARFEIDFSRVFEEPLAHLESMKNCARLESLRSMLAVENGDFGRVVQSQRSMLSMAASLRMEPLVSSQLVRTLIYGTAVESLEYALERVPLPETSASELGALYANAEDPDALIRAFIGERCVSVNYIEALFTGKVEYEKTRAQKVSQYILRQSHWFNHQVYSAANRIRVLEAFEPLVALSGANWPERVSCWSQYDPPDMGIVLPTNFAALAIPVTYRCIPALARREALIRMARTALAVESYRSKHSRLPDSLDSLVPEYLEGVPEDPFDGQPLRYVQLNPGYRLYSIDRDLVDNGGTEAEKDQPGDWHGDWVFEVRR